MTKKEYQDTLSKGEKPVPVTKTQQKTQKIPEP
jgi:hypothetical protein